MSEKEIADVLSLPSLRLEEKVRTLVRMAKAHGGQDNITVLLTEVVKMPPPGT